MPNRKAVVPMVNVRGLAMMPESFKIPYARINFDDTGHINHSNEGQTTVKCSENTSYKNTFNITGHKIEGGYRIRFRVNSAVHSSLWKNGGIIATYSEATQSWTMSGKNYAGRVRNYDYCHADAAWKVNMSAVECVCDDIDGNEDIEIESNALHTAMSSINSGLDAFLASAPVYEKKEACDAAAPGHQERDGGK